MGLDESKLAHPTRTFTPALKICTSGPLIPWRIIHQCSPELWKKCHREYFNFPDKPITCSYQLPNECTIAFCMTRQNIINCRKPAPVFSLRKRKKFTKMAEHFEYNHIPARFSAIHNLHFKSVLASHSGLAVIHLTRNMITEFAVLDLRLNKFLGSFGRQTITFNPESTVGKISPDGNWCLIRLPSPTDRQSSVLKLYDLKGCELLTELFLSPMHIPRPRPSRQLPRPPLSVHQGNNRLRPPESPITPTEYIPTTSSRSAPILFAYDPRFLHSRIAITNLNFTGTAGEIKPSVSLMTLPNWELVATTTSFKCPSVAQRSSPLASSRSVSGRRRASDVNHHIMDGIQTTGNTYTAPHILNLFYSRDGYFLFVVSTEHHVCRCSTIHHHSPTTLPSYPFSGTYDRCGDPPQPSIYHPTTTCVVDSDRSNPVVSFALPNETRSVSKPAGVRTNSFLPLPPVWAPTMPGCTTLWLTIFNSDTLARLRTLRFDRPVCPVHTCPTNYIPVMSRCGSRLAIMTNQYAPVTPPNRSSYPPLSSNRSSALTDPQNLCHSGALLRHSVPAINMEVDSSEEQRQPTLNYSHNSRSKMDVSGDNQTASLSLNPSTRGLARSSPTLPPSAATTVSSSTPIRDRCSSQRLDKSDTAQPSSLSNLSTTTSNNAATVMRQVEVVLVYQLPPPPSLQALIRQKIRQLVQDNMLDHLDLPPRLITYLRFKPTFSCAGSCMSRSNSFGSTLRSESIEFHC